MIASKVRKIIFDTFFSKNKQKQKIIFLNVHFNISFVVAKIKHFKVFFSFCANGYLLELFFIEDVLTLVLNKIKASVSVKQNRVQKYILVCLKQKSRDMMGFTPLTTVSQVNRSSLYREAVFQLFSERLNFILNMNISSR